MEGRRKWGTSRVLLALATVAVPNLLVLASRLIPFTGLASMLLAIWLWSSTWVAVVLAIIASALCPWRSMSSMAVTTGWAAVLIALSVTPSHLYLRQYWLHHEMEPHSIVTAPGLVSDASMTLKLASVGTMVGLIAVVIARRRGNSALG
jgi:hypothetical protein